MLFLVEWDIFIKVFLVLRIHPLETFIVLEHLTRILSWFLVLIGWVLIVLISTTFTGLKALIHLFRIFEWCQKRFGKSYLWFTVFRSKNGGLLSAMFNRLYFFNLCHSEVRHSLIYFRSSLLSRRPPSKPVLLLILNKSRAELITSPKVIRVFRTLAIYLHFRLDIRL